MNNIYNTYQPDGFTTVNAYLMTERPQELIDFLQQSFYAEELSRTMSDDGIIRNCILKIGNTCFMIGQANGEFIGMRTSLYLYTNDVDTLFKNALAHGAKEVFAPMRMDYGDYQGGICDPAGNYWWISKREEEQDY